MFHFLFHLSTDKITSELPNNDNGQSFAWSLEGMNTRQHEQKNAFTFYMNSPSKKIRARPEEFRESKTEGIRTSNDKTEKLSTSTQCRSMSSA